MFAGAAAAGALLRRHRGLARLATGEVVSMLGDWFTYVAVSVVVLEAGSGLLGVALVLIAHTLPRTLAAPFAGWLIDRVELRPRRVGVLVVASLVRGVCVLVMLVSVQLGAVWMLQLALVARMASGAFVDAASSAVLPALVHPEELGLANTIRGTYWSVVFALAVVLGGAATASLGVEFALAVDALSFFMAAAIFGGMERAPRGPATEAEAFDSRRIRLRQRPDVLHAALSKVPVAIANGAGWIALHAISESWRHVALGVGLLHGVRAVGTGVGPLAWHGHRHLGASRRGVDASIAVALFGVALFALSESPWGWLLASLLWGVGVGANWVASCTRVQELTPDAWLGRVSALDIGAQTVAQCLGGLIAALLAPTLGLVGAVTACLALGVVLWTASSCATGALGRRVGIAALTLLTVFALFDTSAATAQDLDIEHELSARRVTDDDFARRSLYSWTTREQAERLRSERQLLVATASSGAGPTPFNRALRTVAGQEQARGAIARALLEDPRIMRRRYAWTSPFGTAVPRGPRSYGHYLVHILLRREAWLGRFEPGRPQPFRFVTTAGRPVPLADVAAHPERIGAIFHVRRPPAVPIAFREYVVCNEAMVKSFSLGTPAIARRVRNEARLLRQLAAGPFARRRRGLAHPTWSSPSPPSTLPDRYRATLAFDGPRHRISPEKLRRIADALDRHAVTGPPFVYRVERGPDP